MYSRRRRIDREGEKENRPAIRPGGGGVWDVSVSAPLVRPTLKENQHISRMRLLYTKTERLSR
jgi:hypothetical protein